MEKHRIEGKKQKRAEERPSGQATSLLRGRREIQRGWGTWEYKTLAQGRQMSEAEKGKVRDSLPGCI